MQCPASVYPGRGTVERERLDQESTLALAVPEQPLAVSVILPVYNEAETLFDVYNEIKKVLDKRAFEYELVFVDDGSTDNTWLVLDEIAACNPRVRALRHRRNFGKASALAAGFSIARGDIMVTTDADLQYDPNDILRLVDKIDEGYDVVSAHKVIRRDPISKRWPSKFFNFFVRRATGIELHDFNAGLKAFRAQVANDLIRYGYGELHRFFAVIAARKGYGVTEVPVESYPRPSGKSKYGMERYVRGALDFLTVFFLSDYMERPLHLLGGLGLMLGGAGTALLAYLTVFGLVYGESIGGRPLLMVSILLILGGLQLLVTGLLAEMIHNVEHGKEGRAKVAEVIRVDRRTSFSLTPGVMVDRRRGRRAASGGVAQPLSRPPSGPSTDESRRVSDRSL